MNGKDAFWRDRRVFVTGCTGLLGASLTQSLVDAGAHVVGLVRDRVHASELWNTSLDKRIDLVSGCVENYELLERSLAEYEIQTVFHLAAQTIVDIANRSPLSTFESNIKGTWCLLEAARRCGFHPHVVVASSDKAYGSHDVLPYTEDAPLVGRHPYDVSKSCTDLISLAYHHSFGAPVCVTRCGNLFGGGDLNWNRLIPGTIRSVHRGQQPVMRSDGTYIRDYFYVKDGAQAYMHLAQRMAADESIWGEAFNFSNESQTTVIELVRMILNQMGSSLEPIILNTAKNEIRHQYLSAEKARRVLDWRASYGLEAGLGETIAWYIDHLRHGESFARRAA